MVAGAGPDEYRQVIDILMTCGDVDAVIVLYIPVGVGDNRTFLNEIAAGVVSARARSAKTTVLGCWMSANERGALAAGSEGIPAYAFPEAPARVLGRMADYAVWRNRADAFVPELDNLRIDEARRFCDGLLAEHGPGWLTLPECFELLAMFGLPVAAHGLARDADEVAAIAWADKVGYPVVLKLSPRQLVHKTDVDGVRLNLADAAAVRSSIRARSRKATAWRSTFSPGESA